MLDIYSEINQGDDLSENFEIPIGVFGIVLKHSQSLIGKGFCRLCLKLGLDWSRQSCAQNL